MAYIPKDEEEQQGGMNILAPQNQQQQNQQSDAQNQPQNVSGGQSATIGSGSAQQGSQQQSQAPKSKQAKSGMFTNIRKYIDRNKPGAQNMSNKLQSNVSQQNQNIQQAIGKQKTDFMSRVESNRARMQNAQQFGQNTLQSAQAQESMPMLQQNQQDLQQRVGQFGNVTDQTQNIGRYTGDEGLISTQQTAYEKAQNDYRNAQKAYRQQAEQFNSMINPTNVVSGQQQQGWITNGQRIQLPNMVNTYYSPEQLNQAIMSGDQNAISAIDQGLSQDRNIVEQYNQNPSMLSFEDASNYEAAQNRLNAFQQYKTNLQAQQSAQQSQTGALSQLESYKDELSRAQEQQRLFQNKTQLEGELAQIQERIDNAPESLTEDDIKRFNQLRTGVERFDDAILNLSEQKRGVEDLTAQAESLGSSQGRRDLMRQEFGRRGGYTSGQAALDNLVLTGDQGAMRELVANSQAQADQAQASLDQAFREGRVTQDEMARGTRNIQRNLQEGVAEAQKSLIGGSQELRDLASQRAEQEAILNNQFASRQDIANAQQALAGINEQISAYEGPLGLSERARRGEGTYIAELRDKLASGQGLSAEDMQILGITGQERFNVDPNQLLQNLQIDPEQFGIQDVANLTDVARADALARLSGEQAGENRFVNQQMGIDQMQRKAIENRSMRDPAEEFTRTREELAPQDRAMVDDFTNKLMSGKVYANVDQARGDIRKNLSRADGNITPAVAQIQNLVENGKTGWEFGEVDLDKILSGDTEEASKIAHGIYWAWAGQGRHGVSFNANDIIRHVRNAHAQTQALKSAYGGTNNNALRSESQSAYVGQQPVNRIRKG